MIFTNQSATFTNSQENITEYAILLYKIRKMKKVILSLGLLFISLSMFAQSECKCFTKTEKTYEIIGEITYEKGDKRIEHMNSLLSIKNSSQHDRINLYFALAKAYADVGENDKLFEVLNESYGEGSYAYNYSHLFDNFITAIVIVFSINVFLELFLNFLLPDILYSTVNDYIFIYGYILIFNSISSLLGTSVLVVNGYTFHYNFSVYLASFILMISLSFSYFTNSLLLVYVSLILSSSILLVYRAVVSFRKKLL